MPEDKQSSLDVEAVKERIAAIRAEQTELDCNIVDHRNMILNAERRRNALNSEMRRLETQLYNDDVYNRMNEAVRGRADHFLNNGYQLVSARGPQKSGAFLIRADLKTGVFHMVRIFGWNPLSEKMSHVERSELPAVAEAIQLLLEPQKGT